MNIGGNDDSEFMWCYKCRDKGLKLEKEIDRLHKRMKLIEKTLDFALDDYGYNTQLINKLHEGIAYFNSNNLYDINLMLNDLCESYEK